MSVYQLDCNYSVRSLRRDFSLTTYINTQDMPDAHRDNIYESIFYKSGNQFIKLSNQEQRDSYYNVDFNAFQQLTTPVNFDDINDVKYRVNLLSPICSLCRGFNRSWNCCGQFAPFFYIYYFFKYDFRYGNETSFDNFFGRLYFPPGQQPTQDQWLKNIARGFYKIFTSYGASTGNGYDLVYQRGIRQINNRFGNIQSIHNNPSYWLTNTTNISINAYHIFVLRNSRGEIAHFGFIQRRGDYVIICDSWTHDTGYYDNNNQWVERKGSRSAVTRVIAYDEYESAVSTINDLCDMIQIERDRSTRKKLLYMYNFVIDSLFLIPYHDDSITDGDLTCENNDELCKFYLVNNDSINSVLGLIIDNPGFFNAYINLGGNKKERGNKKEGGNKKRKSTKKRNQKRGKTQRKRLTN